MTNTQNDYPHVAVIGAGFAGLQAARELRKKPVQVTLIDRNNYHTFQPLLYQVATAGLDPSDISHSVRDLLQRAPNVHFRLSAVAGIDKENRRLLFEDGQTLEYDYLVVAAGAITNYFGLDSIEAHAFSLKSVEEAVALRSHILRQFERADQNPDLIDEGILNFVLVGGGPTGVEMAGALTELFRLVLKKDYRTFDVSRARVVLIEMQDGLLTAYDRKLQEYTVRALERMGVEVQLETSVVTATPSAVKLKSGDVIPTQTLIWAAGIRAHPLADMLGVEQTRGARVVVEEDLSLPGRPEVFVAGDMAATTNEDGNLHPQVAQYAMQGGRHAARQILNRVDGKSTKPFTYRDLGEMATIGRHAAVAELPIGLKMKGFLAWLGWLFLHLVKLVGFRNRLSVFINWMWNYFTYDRSARLILGNPVEEEPRVVLVEEATEFETEPAA